MTQVKEAKLVTLRKAPQWYWSAYELFLNFCILLPIPWLHEMSSMVNNIFYPPVFYCCYVSCLSSVTEVSKLFYD